MNRDTAENTYTLLNLVGGVSGSAGAYKSLVKEGQFVSKGIKSKTVTAKIVNRYGEILQVSKIYLILPMIVRLLEVQLKK